MNEENLEAMSERIKYLEEVVNNLGYLSKAAKKRRFKSI